MKINVAILITISLLVTVLFAIDNFAIEPSALQSYTLLQQLPVSNFVLYLFGCGLMPIVEEIGFRYWVRAKRWGKYLSLIVFMLLIFGTNILLWVVLALVGALYVSVRESPITFNVIFSSLFFGLIHLKWGVFDISFFFFFFFYFMMGVLFCLLYIKKGIELSIIVHICYNTVLLLILVKDYKGFEDKIVKCDVGKSRCVLKYHNIFYSNKLPVFKKYNDSTIIVGMNKEAVIYALLNKQNGYFYFVEPSMDKVSLSLVGPSDSERSILALKALRLKFDTSEVEVMETHTIHYRPTKEQFNASELTHRKANYVIAGTIADIAERLSRTYNMPFESPDSNYVFINMPFYADFAQYRRVLDSVYGLKFVTSTRELRKIDIRF